MYDTNATNRVIVYIHILSVDSYISDCKLWVALQ